MNSITRLNQFAAAPRDGGGWFWDGSQWICSPCPPTDGVPPFPCPPPGFPPPGCPPWFSSFNSPPWYPGANAGVSFGQAAAFPANPVRGHFFWDGHTLWMFDGAAWVATGGVAAGTPPSSTPPINPAPGQQWFNGSTLFVWDGNAWVPVSQTKSYIQATAPPAPNPGDTWWDGTQFHIWDGSAWEIVGPGATVGPVPTTTHTFSILLGAPSITVPTGYGILPFTSTPSIDTQGAWISTTQQIKPKVAGNYLITLTGWGEGGTGQNQMYMLKNDPGAVNSANINTQMGVAVGGVNAATVGASMGGTGMTRMNGTTDFLRLWLYVAGTQFFPFAAQVPVIDMWLLP